MNPPYLDGGECLNLAPDTMFPDARNDADVAAAKQVCARCPVQERCLEWALANDERFGVWGGSSEDERRADRVKRRQSAFAAAGA